MDYNPNAILGDGSLDTRIVDGEVFLNSNGLADLLTGATLYLTQYALMTDDLRAAGMAQGYSELVRQTDNLRAQLLQEHAEASYNL